MTRFQEMVSSPTVTQHGPFRFGRLYAVYLGAILLIGSVAVIGVTFGIDREPQSIGSQASTAVTDGWMTSITYANRERAAAAASATVDGWASALLKPEPPVVDGWAAALLRPEPAVVDGWASRYLVDDGN